MREPIQWERAHSHFQAFRNNLPGIIDEDCVSEYHAIIDALEEAGQGTLGEFRIDASKITFVMVQSRSGEHIDPRVGVQYSNKKYCDREYFCPKLDQLQDILNRPDQTST